MKTDTDVSSPNLKKEEKKPTSVFLWQDFYGKTQHSFQELLKESGAVLLSNPHASHHLVFVCVVIVLCCAVPLDNDPPDVSFESESIMFSCPEKGNCTFCACQMCQWGSNLWLDCVLRQCLFFSYVSTASSGVYIHLQVFLTDLKNTPPLNTVDTNTYKEEQR